MKQRTLIMLAFVALASMFLVGGAYAQAVPSLVTQQMRLSTGGATPNYVQHRAITGALAAPGASNTWYAWDQVPLATAGQNYLLFLNGANEVRRTNMFTIADTFRIARVNALGDNIEFVDPTSLVEANNGLSVFNPGGIVQLGGDLIQNTTVDLDGFNMGWVNGSATAATYTLGDGTNVLNLNINPGTGGNVNIQNLTQDDTLSTLIVRDLAGNIHTRTLESLVDADNGLIANVVNGQTIVSLGAPATGGAPLLTDRFVSLSGNDLNFEGTGNFNLGDAASSVTTNIHTGTGAGVLTFQGATRNSTVGINNFAFVNEANNEVHIASTLALDSAAVPDQYITIDNAGNVRRSPSPVVNFIRGQIPGDGNFQYTQNNVQINAGAAIIATVENHTAVLGTIVVQVTNVTTGVNGSFSVEAAESIQSGSFINYTIMNP